MMLIKQTLKNLVHYLLFFCFLSSVAQTSKINFVDTEIVVDGNFDEAVWSQIPEHTGFYNYLPTDIGLAKNQTVVKIFHNGTYLYLSAVYNDTTEKNQVSTLKRDVSIALSDAFVMVFDTQNQQQNGYLFAVNALGNQTDGLIGRNNEAYNLSFSWNAIWQSKVQVNGKKKHYEVAIPLKSLNFDKKNPVFGVQFYVRDIKNNSWTILKNVKRNYASLDLRFTEKFLVANLPNASTTKFSVTPSLTANYQNNVAKREEEFNLKPSLDIQYNLSSSLKLDATLNPDFSQIDVDQQVANLTRFAVNFPERRNFFLENADLFSNLGVAGVNPFYSRRIGAESPVSFGFKLSGNLTPNTRIGVLNAQTKNKKQVGIPSQNFGVFVAEHQLSKNFTATGFFINRQETSTDHNTNNDYNRVVGSNLAYKSNNNNWFGLLNLGKSFNDGLSNANGFYNAGLWFNKRGLRWNASIKKVEKNYLTDVGFVPRLYHFDAIANRTYREGYDEFASGIVYEKFYDKSKTLNSIRFLNYSNNSYFDDSGAITQSTHAVNSALFFKDLSSIYYVYTYNKVVLKYGFSPLSNGGVIEPESYGFGLLKIGYNSPSNQRFNYRLNLQKGSYYKGERMAFGAYLNYQLLPFANLELSYDVNKIDLKHLGKESFHLTRFTGEVFFNNRFNWTTYLQVNTQTDNFNINTRLQWEYKPLSYMYVVVSDNFNETLKRTNWGIAFKMNYRFDF
ncbi:hypothetical protein GCM10011416_15710 [Polaribacter pacificus]|uniref:DUF5916 domain-containing protein n=1 Tax=Polaribacter pacificus TaxID=1775173 RepID=A0A917HZV3_9FLAO|nr:DUF5916 domain-containing protein [Polaribacter pacificus]GGG98430.1 hypothetical protein GCM10011416_15710 [Polaribacter pacificus]